MDLSCFKIKSVRSENAGLSMIEILTVVAIIAILSIMAISTLPRQLEKSRDSRRKADLQKIKVAFEHYYNDHGCYPSDDILSDYCDGTQTVDHELSPYLPIIPCDPKDGEAYLYAPYDDTGGSENCDGYRVWANLEKNDDPVIAQLHCDGASGCGAFDFFEAELGQEATEYNYGVSEGVPVFTGNETSYMQSGWCCSNLSGDRCNAWTDGNGTCIVGPYSTANECVTNTVCVDS